MTRSKQLPTGPGQAEEPAPPASLADINIRKPGAARSGEARVKSGDITRDIEKLRSAGTDTAGPATSDGKPGDESETPPAAPSRRLHKPAIPPKQHELLKQTFSAINQRTTGAELKKSPAAAKASSGEPKQPAMPAAASSSAAPPGPPTRIVQPAQLAGRTGDEPEKAPAQAAAERNTAIKTAFSIKAAVLAELGHRVRMKAPTPGAKPPAGAAAASAPGPTGETAAVRDPSTAAIVGSPAKPVGAATEERAVPSAPEGDATPKEPDSGRSGKRRSVSAYFALRKEIGEMARNAEIPAAPVNVKASESRELSPDEATTSRIARIRSRTRNAQGVSSTRAAASQKPTQPELPSAQITPPAAKPAQKQAVPTDLYAYWSALRGTRPHPCRAELDLDMVRAQWPNTLLLRYAAGSTVELDSSFSRGLGHAPSDDTEATECVRYTPMVIEWLISLGLRVAREGEPVDDVDEFPLENGRVRYGATALPLGNAPDSVDHVICHVWVE